MSPSSSARISRSVDVQASAEEVWRIVSDLPAMGELSPENKGGRWRGDATGPAAGARFRGANAQGSRRWSTDVMVTDCEPGRRFAFAVKAAGLPVATWSYDLEPIAEGSCRVTETWQDGRGALVRRLGALTTGVKDRTAFTATSIEQTLARLKDRAEQSA